MQLLLAHGAAVNLAKSNGFSSLMASCQQGHAECAKLLLDADARECCEIRTVWLPGCGCLDVAAWMLLFGCCCLDVAARLLLLDCCCYPTAPNSTPPLPSDVDAMRSDDGWSSLMLSCQNG